MQTGYELENGAYMTITVAGYLPPSGKSYHGFGVHPDIEAPLDPAYVDQSIYTLPLDVDAAMEASLMMLAPK